MPASSHIEQSDYVKDFYCVMVEEKALTNYITARDQEKKITSRHADVFLYYFIHNLTLAGCSLCSISITD